jgi:hypothetical protein
MERLVRGVPYILSIPPDPRHKPFWVPAIKITTWSPSTCYCTVNFWWDRRVAAEKRKHLYCSSKDAVRLRPDKLRLLKGKLRHRELENWRWQEAHCEFHAGLKGESWFRALLRENMARIVKKPETEAEAVALVLKNDRRKRKPV